MLPAVLIPVAEAVATVVVTVAIQKLFAADGPYQPPSGR